MGKIWLISVPNHAARVAEGYLQAAHLEYIRFAETDPRETEPVVELEDGREFKGLRKIEAFCLGKREDSND